MESSICIFCQDPPSASDRPQDKSSDEHAQGEITTTSDPDETRNHHNDCQARDSPSLLKAAADSNSSAGKMHHIEEPEAFSSSVSGSEPIYEGEECILDSGTIAYESREPVYEGEVVLAEQVDNRGCMDVGAPNSKEGISINTRNFLRNSASQLTIYGLFCLQDKVKERELCVFFRNNHFNTMFKYEGELYILATDQGYINQPDLVWEKLNEVNGDTVYMTGNFKEFRWRTIPAAQQPLGGSFVLLFFGSSDLQLAIALQQQEFEQQQQQQQQEQQPQRILQQPAVSGGSRLVTGPQVSRSSGKHTSSSKQESKSKEKCIVM
ncbi:Ubiquitin carboxyl-terminal hydrolase MINDY-2 [Sesamum alatum]|uniref:Ubiquitin carboxyl-terminal hydrolase MINDY-2 n=1 Tax=Sesamum alatum TaxID=300844 RepID=A0AAE2CUS4_9LAMI|nr:Ubiquitin carboxyl-terminal hydrolase MINDY-2 [Sesamum alatum]